MLLRGVGHLSLPIDGRVVHEITTLLAHLDEHGATVTAGVTPFDMAPSGQPEASSPRRSRLRGAGSTTA